VSARSSGQVPNAGLSWKVALAQVNPQIALLTSTRDYSMVLDPSYKRARYPAYSNYCPDSTQHVVAHDYFAKKVAPIQDVLSFLKARQILAESELSGQPSGLQITQEALAVVTSWAGPNQAANNFYELARDKKLHPECLSAADRMVQRVLADELLYMPQCADPWHWQAGPDNCPNRNAVYYN